MQFQSFEIRRLNKYTQSPYGIRLRFNQTNDLSLLSSLVHWPDQYHVRSTKKRQRKI